MHEMIIKKLTAYFESSTGSTPESNENLFDGGALDSFGIVEFLAFLEKELNADIRLEDITMDNFSSIERIACLVAESGGHV